MHSAIFAAINQVSNERKVICANLANATQNKSSNKLLCFIEILGVYFSVYFHANGQMLQAHTYAANKSTNRAERRPQSEAIQQAESHEID